MKAFITGVNGQDGAYLTELLLSKGYEIHGLIRRSSVNTTERLKPFEGHTSFKLHHGDMTDSSNLIRLVGEIKPREIYNLAAQSHVAVSFETPEYTANADAIGTLRLLEAVRMHDASIRYYQASTSELYGKVQETPQRETTPFYPRSPYAAAKLYAYWLVVNYREAYNLHASNGILFNHESPLRGETFVTRKITLGVANILKGDKQPIRLGNLDAKRDWGHAKDYVEAMWLMLQQEKPDDYVIATRQTQTVRTFVEMAFDACGLTVHWQGEGANEKGVNAQTGDVLVQVDPRFYRPTEVDLLLGDPSKARKNLNWEVKTSLKEMVHEMVEEDVKNFEHRRTLLLG